MAAAPQKPAFRLVPFGGDAVIRPFPIKLLKEGKTPQSIPKSTVPATPLTSNTTSHLQHTFDAEMQNLLTELRTLRSTMVDRQVNPVWNAAQRLLLLEKQAPSLEAVATWMRPYWSDLNEHRRLMTDVMRKVGITSAVRGLPTDSSQGVQRRSGSGSRVGVKIE